MNLQPPLQDIPSFMQLFFTEELLQCNIFFFVLPGLGCNH